MTSTIETLSGISGSVSIACWIVVFSPQIIENFRRSSAEGLSIFFVMIWLTGDIFNILGSVLQGVLPTMIILAIYYALADIVLLSQCFYYKGFVFRDEITQPSTDPDEQTSLLRPEQDTVQEDEQQPSSRRVSWPDPQGRRPSSIREQLQAIDGSHLSPATPMHGKRDTDALLGRSPATTRSRFQAFISNLTIVLLVIAAGVLGWWLSTQTVRSRERIRHNKAKSHQDTSLDFSIPGQIFGYICTAFYLGSRVPQLLLNYRRKSTEGISMLFFTFACIGNLTYVMSILFYVPVCEGRHCHEGEAAAIYWRHILVNLSWLLGSAGTLLLDLGVFAQYFSYHGSSQGNTAIAE